MMNDRNQCNKKTIPDERTFVFTENNTKQDLLDFFTEKKGYGTFYINVKDEQLLVLEFLKDTPVKYDIHYLDEFPVMQVSLEEMVENVCTFCENQLSKEDADLDRYF